MNEQRQKVLTDLYAKFELLSNVDLILLRLQIEMIIRERNIINSKEYTKDLIIEDLAQEINNLID